MLVRSALNVAAPEPVRVLAEAVPQLQSRTVALAITGASDGTWLIDEDGDPVCHAWLPQDRRAEPVVARWRHGGAALRVHEISGRPIGGRGGRRP